MGFTDRQPIPNSAGIDRIVPKENNRLGATFSALYSFWIARQAAVDLPKEIKTKKNKKKKKAAVDHNLPVGGARRDAYSMIFFNHEAETSIENDFTNSPDELLTAALAFDTGGGKFFHRALERAHMLMTSHWSMERYPFPSKVTMQCTIHRLTFILGRQS
jgi:hypothetical protein